MDFDSVTVIGPRHIAFTSGDPTTTLGHQISQFCGSVACLVVIPQASATRYDSRLRPLKNEFRSGQGSLYPSDLTLTFRLVYQSVFNDLWAVDLPCGRFWRQIPIASNFPLPRIGHSAVAMGNRILIYGGRNFKTGAVYPPKRRPP